MNKTLRLARMAAVGLGIAFATAVTPALAQSSVTYGPGYETHRKGTKSSTYGKGYETHRQGNRSSTYGKGYETHRQGNRSVTYFPGGRTERFNTPCGPASITYTASGVTRRGGC